MRQRAPTYLQQVVCRYQNLVVLAAGTAVQKRVCRAAAAYAAFAAIATTATAVASAVLRLLLLLLLLSCCCAAAVLLLCCCCCHIHTYEYLFSVLGPFLSSNFSPIFPLFFSNKNC